MRKGPSIRLPGWQRTRKPSWRVGYFRDRRSGLVSVSGLSSLWIVTQNEAQHNILDRPTQAPSTAMKATLSQKLAAEFVAMTLFVFVGCGTAVSSQVRRNIQEHVGSLPTSSAGSLFSTPQNRMF